MPQTIITYRPHGAALELFHNREPEIMLSGPAGTGKSRASLEKLHLVAQKYAGCRLLMARLTRKSLTQTTMVTFEQKVLHPLDHVHFRTGEQEYRYPNGSKLVVGGLDDPNKILSSEYDIAYVPESIEIEVADWENLFGRLRYGVTPYNQILGDTNPGSTEHWIYKRWQLGALTMLWSEHKHNPELFNQVTGELTPFGADYIGRLDRMTGFRYQRLRLGKWVGAEGVVYPEFVPKEHVMVVDVRDWPTKVLGVDVGTRNPFAIEMIAQSADERIHIAGETYRSGMTSSEQVDAVCRACDDFDAEGIFIDPSAASLILELEALGYPVQKATNDRRYGVAAVHDAMARGLTVDPSCAGFLREVGLYAYPSNTTERDDPIKKDDHAMDATRYGIVGINELVVPGIY